MENGRGNHPPALRSLLASLDATPTYLTYPPPRMEISRERLLRTSFKGLREERGILHEVDLRVTPRARLLFKTLIFKNSSALRQFWKLSLGRDELGRWTQGAVWATFYTATASTDFRTVLIVDERYFCLIGLVRTHLTMEILSHEAVHAAYAYERRVKRTPWEEYVRNFPEEAIAYPAGRIAAALNREIYRAGLYPR